MVLLSGASPLNMTSGGLFLYLLKIIVVIVSCLYSRSMFSADIALYIFIYNFKKTFQVTFFPSFPADSWISQSASVPRNQKQTGVDSPSPATSLPKPPGQSSSTTSSSGSQPQPRTVKVIHCGHSSPV